MSEICMKMALCQSEVRLQWFPKYKPLATQGRPTTGIFDMLEMMRIHLKYSNEREVDYLSRWLRGEIL